MRIQCSRGLELQLLSRCLTHTHARDSFKNILSALQPKLPIASNDARHLARKCSDRRACAHCRQVSLVCLLSIKCVFGLSGLSCGLWDGFVWLGCPLLLSRGLWDGFVWLRVGLGCSLWLLRGLRDGLAWASWCHPPPLSSPWLVRSLFVFVCICFYFLCCSGFKVVLKDIYLLQRF